MEMVDVPNRCNRKEWFCGKDVCEILGFEDSKKTLQRQVRQSCKFNFKNLVELGEGCSPIPEP